MIPIIIVLWESRYIDQIALDYCESQRNSVQLFSTNVARIHWASTGSLSACPDDSLELSDVSSEEAKAMRLLRFMELRWTAETSQGAVI